MNVKKTDPIILVIATRNQGKFTEIESLLQGFPVNLKNLNDFGPIPEVVEDGATFEENAYKKAAFTSRVLGYPALADDSGLVVEALSGAPGIQSARWGGPDLTDEGRFQKLLKEMEGRKNRTAFFQCVVSIAVPQGQALTYEGRCEGLIADRPKGDSGFGYDPIFFYPPLKKTFAQLTLDEKNKISHRGKVLHEIQNEFDKIIFWLNRHMPIQQRFDCALDE